MNIVVKQEKQHHRYLKANQDSTSQQPAHPSSQSVGRSSSGAPLPARLTVESGLWRHTPGQLAAPSLPAPPRPTKHRLTQVPAAAAAAAAAAALHGWLQVQEGVGAANTSLVREGRKEGTSV